MAIKTALQATALHWGYNGICEQLIVLWQAKNTPPYPSTLSTRKTW